MHWDWGCFGVCWGVPDSVIYKDGWSDHGRGKCGGINSCPGEPYKPGKVEKCVQSIIGVSINYAIFKGSGVVKAEGLKWILERAGVFVPMPTVTDALNKCFK